jgi:outer membrane cobalamin receptor
MINRFLYIIVFVVLASNNVFADLPDTIRIEQINIIDKYIPDNIGYHVTKIDSVLLNMYQQENLSTLLTLNSPIFIKDYGPGNIASSSFRGANASHTQVLWNGININSPMLGQVDFSQIPTNMIDEVIVYHGGATVSGNNGAIGGTINIFSRPNWNIKKDINFVQEFGSFGKSHSYISGQFGNKKLMIKTRIIYNMAQNNFSYKIIPYEFSSTYYQQNASYDSKGFVEELYYRITDQSLFSVNTWIQQNKNEIPSNSNDEKQLNNNIKTSLGYQLFKDNWNVKASLAHLYNYMNYKKELINLNSKNEINSLVSNLDFTTTLFSKYELNISNNLNYHLVESNNFLQKYERAEADNSISLKSNAMGLLNYYVSVKNQFVDFNSYRIIPSLGFDLHVSQNISFFGSYNQNYHYPTLNDLYWEYDGNAKGNSELNPEKGFSSEIGLEFSKDYKLFKHSLSLTTFYSKIQDWILWQYNFDDVLNQMIWFPENLRNVERKGIEVSIKNTYQFHDITFINNLNYQYVRAENKTAYSQNDNSKNKQLIYVPENLINGSVSIIYMKYGLHFFYNFVDKRYTTSSNTDYLEAYQLFNVKCGRSFNVNQNNINLQLGVSNFTNQNYQIVSGKPMPQRFFSFTLKYQFLHK